MSTFNTIYVKSWLKSIFFSLRQTQQQNLALSVVGLMKSHSGLLSEIVREVPGSNKHKHKLKRLQRFLANHRVKPGILMRYWMVWIIKTFVKTNTIRVALDWTTLPGDIQVLMAAIPTGGRAVPLFWTVITYDRFKTSQNRIEETLISLLCNLVRTDFPDKQILLTADRGFGRSKFIKFLIGLNIQFALRVKADVIVTTQKGKSLKLRSLKIKPNKIKWLENISYRSDGIVTGVNLAITLAETDKDPDPWLIITNLNSARETIDEYARRFQIEEWFKDLKHQLGLSNLQTPRFERIKRLMVISCVAYGLTLLIGNLIDTLLPGAYDQLISGGKKAASVVWIALRVIKNKLAPSSFWKELWVKAKASQLALGP